LYLIRNSKKMKLLKNRPTKSKGTGEGDRRPGEGGKLKNKTRVGAKRRYLKSP
jgi:hypothetical protein